ncbi:uncharacterized protein JCM6883_001624 [Sporobolomyces salmoneus]|uniref:uncharacterized protein n=1 Tax=Sporobolomyces salmoneus TaxID=183962 RepID=UPI003181C1E8
MACCRCSILPTLRAGPSTGLTLPIRHFSSTSLRLAHPTELDLTFPTKKNPDPFEIFHFARNEPLNAKVVKSRYLDLVRKYHPDRMQQTSTGRGKGKGKAKQEESVEFKQIVAAYELLSDPKKRASYLDFGLGWGAAGSPPGGGGGSGSPWSQSTNEYHFRRGRPMSSSSSGHRFSGTYDFYNTSWTDPHNPHFRPERAGGVGNTSGPGWEGRGTIGKNGFIFLGLASITLFISPLTAWYSFPSVVSPEEMAAANGENGTAWIPRMYDKRHLDAATNLQLARTEAKQQAKLEAFRRRARQIEREKAFERAQQIQAIERSGGTGHLALPPPSSSS